MARAYDSAVRRERADLTRRQVVDAAGAVFAELGWAGTTMTAIADRAGVAVETVYRAVRGGKPALLAAAVQGVLAGGAARSEVATERRPGIRRVIESPDARSALATYAEVVVSTWRRSGPLLAVVETAGSELAPLRRELEAQRLAGMGRFADQIAPELRPGLTPSRAADIIWAVCGRANYDALVVERGWSPAEYASWVSQTLAAALLVPR